MSRTSASADSSPDDDFGREACVGDSSGVCVTGGAELVVVREEVRDSAGDSDGDDSDSLGSAELGGADSAGAGAARKGVSAGGVVALDEDRPAVSRGAPRVSVGESGVSACGLEPLVTGVGTGPLARALSRSTVAGGIATPAAAFPAAVAAFRASSMRTTRPSPPPPGSKEGTATTPARVTAVTGATT
jgi:hypothetical protein